MKKNIVIIDHESLSIRKKQNYLIDEFINNGFYVEYWDTSQYFFPNIDLGAVLNENYCYNINSLDDLTNNINRVNIQETVFIVEAFLNWNNRYFFKALKSAGCCIIKVEMYATANVAYLTILEKLKQASLRQLFQIFIKKISSYLFDIFCSFNQISYDLYISSGIYKEVDYHINHPDWELFNKIKDNDVKYDSKYLVFLDEYFPLHPDLKYYCNYSGASEKDYRVSINKYFQLLEGITGCKVIIAAHPKSNYTSEEFDGRLIIKNDTVSLVKDSQGVIMHSSAALSFAIMFNKPIVLISTNDYLRATELKKNQLSISKFLNLPILNIDETHTVDQIGMSYIQTEVRDTYIYKYLTTPKTKDKKNIDILMDILRRL